MTNDNSKNKNDSSTTYGTVVAYDNGMYVKLDGSDLLTPVDTTTELRDNDRVLVNIGGHNAVVSGNMTNPAVCKSTAGELESSIIQTAESIRLEVKNTKEGLESSIKQTAESIRLEVENTKEGLESSIEQTAESIRLEVENTKEGLESKIEQTASSLTTSINNVNSDLSSRITQTTTDLTAIFKDGYNEGITKINKDGITVSHTGYNGYTKMSSSGFYINNGSENLFSATSSGVSVKGNIVVTSGSININNNFIVSSYGALTTNSTIMAQGGIYTYQDIRGMDTTPVTGGLTLVTNVGNICLRNESTDHSVYIQPAGGRAYITYPNTSDRADLSLRNLYGVDLLELSGSSAVVRATHDGHLYLQCGSSNAELLRSEVRCTRSADPNNYVNIRAYNVCAEGGVFAQGVNVSSDRNKKRDIELYNVDAIKEICSTPVYTYHLDGDLDDELKRVGLIMQEAPLDAIDLNGKGIDLYQMASMLWRAIQQQQDMIDDLQTMIKRGV